MRKPRDFDAELKALEDKARDLKSSQGAATRRTGDRHRSRCAHRRRTGGRADRAGRNQGRREEGGVGQARGRVLSEPAAAICISSLTATLAALRRNRAARNRQQASTGAA